MPRIYAFLDTMILLQFRPFQEIDWPELLGTDEVELVMAKVVLTELDIHKNGDNRRLRDGSRRVRRELDSLYAQVPTLVRSGVWLSFRLAHPETVLANTSLSAAERDDVLVASMLAFKADHPERDLVLVSDDANPRFTARSFHLNVVEPPDNLRLQDIPDGHERELAEARREIDRLRSARPKLDLRFAKVPKGAPLVVTLYPPEELTTHALIAAVEQERQRRMLPDESGTMPVQLMHLTGQQLAKYNSELSEYLERYRRYLTEHWEYREGRKRSFILGLEVWNDGTAPANDVDIHIHFPDGFAVEQIVEDENDEDEPEAPEPPFVPLSLLQEAMEGMQHFDLRPMTDYRLPTQNLVRGLDPRQFRIRRSESYDVTANIKRVKQRMPFPFHPLRLQFDSDYSVTNFSLHYRLQPVELPDPVEEDLHVVVTR
jgi:hypothetical protein